MPAIRFRWFAIALVLACLLSLGAQSRTQAAGREKNAAVQIMVPGEDRFTPFAITVKVGQGVEWVNNDTDDHLIISNDAFNTAGHRGTSVLLPGGGGTFRLQFNHEGVFPYYCGFHAMLDADNQPKAPGPDGGIQDGDGNFGTPMNGVITVVAD